MTRTLFAAAAAALHWVPGVSEAQRWIGPSCDAQKECSETFCQVNEAHLKRQGLIIQIRNARAGSPAGSPAGLPAGSPADWAALFGRKSEHGNRGCQERGCQICDPSTPEGRQTYVSLTTPLSVRTNIAQVHYRRQLAIHHTGSMISVMLHYPRLAFIDPVSTRCP